MIFFPGCLSDFHKNEDALKSKFGIDIDDIKESNKYEGKIKR